MSSNVPVRRLSKATVQVETICYRTKYFRASCFRDWLVFGHAPRTANPHKSTICESVLLVLGSLYKYRLNSWTWCTSTVLSFRQYLLTIYVLERILPVQVLLDDRLLVDLTETTQNEASGLSLSRTWCLSMVQVYLYRKTPVRASLALLYKYKY